MPFNWGRSVGLQSRQVEGIFKNMNAEKLPAPNRVLLLKKNIIIIFHENYCEDESLQLLQNAGIIAV